MRVRVMGRRQCVRCLVLATHCLGSGTLCSCSISHDNRLSLRSCLDTPVFQQPTCIGHALPVGILAAIIY
ncbi:hypothetical protein BDW68DRAFT_165997 [Aspergillus falconensis]